jgi:predicted HTH transcriptional regulator
MLYGGVTLQEILNGTSKIRNKVLATVFAEMYIIEKWGTGIQRVIDGCREYGIADPEWIELGTTFRVNIYRPKQVTPSNTPPNGGVSGGVNDGLNETEKSVLAVIKQNGQFTAEELAIKIGKSKRTAERTLKLLKDKALIRRQGADKNGYWEIVAADEE